MGDSYGLMPLPAAAWTVGTTLADPALDILASFITALINDKGSAAWVSVDPAHPSAVMVTKTFDPQKGGFNEAWLPALFLWRSDVEPSQWLAHDYFIGKSNITVLWVPPTTTQENRAIRGPFINLVAKAIDSVLAPDARTPGWVQPGDTDPLTPGNGSLLWTYLTSKTFRLDMVQKAQPAQLRVTMADNSVKTYDAVQLVLGIWEQNTSHQDDADFLPMGDVQGQIFGGSDGTFPGPSFDFHVTIASCTPNSGTHLGGTAIAVQGTGYVAGLTITIGGVPCTGVTLTGGALITAVTPAGAIGAADIVVTNPSGESATLAGGFTFT